MGPLDVVEEISTAEVGSRSYSNRILKYGYSGTGVPHAGYAVRMALVMVELDSSLTL